MTQTNARFAAWAVGDLIKRLRRIPAGAQGMIAPIG